MYIQFIKKIILVFFFLAVLIIDSGLIIKKFDPFEPRRVTIIFDNSPAQIFSETVGAIEEKIDEIIVGDTEPENDTDSYAIHKNITSTVFWIGEKASDDNAGIANESSAWDEEWKKHFGGMDDPEKRKGYQPQGFVPKENPFYAALPYNDFDKNGRRKSDALRIIPWANEKEWKRTESLCKNRWIKIDHGSKTAYVQWQDVGPFLEDDAGYVFQNARPKNKKNGNAGIDVSPAARDYLGLKDIDTVDWQFIDEKDVPEGDWKKVVAQSQVYWK